MVYSGIYGIYNLETGMPYVGSAQNLTNRERDHWWMLRNNRHDNIHLQRSYNKYGEDAFQFEVLELVDDLNKLTDREQYYIDYYGIENLYNICPVAGSTRGRTVTEETRVKLSDAHRGKILSDETRARIGVAHRGKKKSPEQIENMRIANLGKKLSDEHRANIGVGGRGKKRSLETKTKLSMCQKGKPSRLSKETSDRVIEGLAAINRKQVKQIDVLSGEVINIFSGVRVAARALGLNSSLISQVAGGCRKTSGGFRWEYVEQHEERKCD